MFRIKKLYFIVGGIILVFIPLSLMLYTLFISQKLCGSKKLATTCGVTLSTTGDVSVVTGSLINKYKRGDMFYFQMLTLDKKQKPYTLTFTNPPNFPKMIINNAPLLLTGKNLPTNFSQRTVPINDFYDQVHPQTPIRVFIYNPKKLTVAQIEKAPDALRKCIPYQNSVLEYLENPSFKAGMLSRYLSLKDGCEVTLANVSL